MTKIFKSGSSIAVRLPKTSRFTPGTEVEIMSSDDGFHVRLRPIARKICLDGIIGSLPGFMAGGPDEPKAPKRG